MYFAFSTANNNVYSSGKELEKLQIVRNSDKGNTFCAKNFVGHKSNILMQTTLIRKIMQ
jgi:hypothetical protein